MTVVTVPANTALKLGASALAASPDGSMLATIHVDTTTRLWNITTPDRPTELTSLTGATAFVTFSPDGRALATSNRDATVRLWDITNRAHPTESAALVDDHSVVFSPDGKTVATVGNHSVRLWETTPSRIISQACSIVQYTITPFDWERHFPGLPYRPPCP